MGIYLLHSNYPSFELVLLPRELQKCDYCMYSLRIYSVVRKGSGKDFPSMRE